MDPHRSDPLDVDPPDGAFDAAVEVALMVLEVLDDLGVATGVKTTGGKGVARRRADRAPIRRERASPGRRDDRGALLAAR